MKVNLINNLKLVFIVGCQRSGTTVIGTILGAQPNAYLIDESDGLYQWMEAVFAGEGATETNELLAQCCSNARRNYRQPNTRCDKNGNLSDTVSHLILKAPNLTYSADKIAKYFARVFCIFPYRDIRDIVVSMGKLDWIPMVENQLQLIKDSPQISKRFQREVHILENSELGPHLARAYVARIKISLRDTFAPPFFRKLEVCYEDLVQHPEMWLNRLLTHIQLAADIQEDGHVNTMAGLGPGINFRRSKINTFSIGKWQTVLTKSQEVDIWEIAKPVMQQLNYKREPYHRIQPVQLDSPMSNLHNKPVIATGRGGSGTRLLSKLLQALDIFLGNEMNEVEDSIEWVGLVYNMAVERIQQNSPQMDNYWRHILQETTANILTVNQWDGLRPWGLKLPEVMLVLPEIFAVFDQGVFIHIVRHPVDLSIRGTHVTSRVDNPIGKSVLKAAYKSLDWEQDKITSDPSYLRNAASWLYQVSEATRFGREELGPGRYLEIRYEDICSNPDVALESLANFLNLQVNPQPLDLGIEPHRRRNWSPPDTRADQIWEVCGSLAMQLGYHSIDSREI